MLDNETKRRIDTARDILVGKVPDPKSQVEQITIALIYKFMDDMDAEAEEIGGKRNFFSGEFAMYGWKKLMAKKLGGFEVLTLYAEAIQKMNINENIPPLFRDIFKNAYLPYRDPETLKSFLKIIDEFEYDHSERLGDAFEYLLSVLGSQGDAGQFRTPRHIIDFMVYLVDPKKNETIIDPACGTAGFLISSYKHIVKNNSREYKPEDENNLVFGNGERYSGDKLTPDERKQFAVNIKGYDISPDMVRLSLVNLYLHGFTSPQIIEYDSLTSMDKWNEFSEVMLANPPFMSPKGGIKPHKRFSIESKRSEVLFVDYIAEHLTPNGRAAVIVPEGIIFQSGTAYKRLRKMLVEKYLYAVVSLPGGVFNPYSGVKTSILLMDKNLSKRTDKILFAKVENDGFGLGAQRRANDKGELPYIAITIKKYINSVLNGTDFDADGYKNIIIATKEKIAENEDWNLNGERYRANINQEHSNYIMKKLGDICVLQSGSRQKGGAIEYGIPSIGGEQISIEGKILYDKMKFITPEHYKTMNKGVLQNEDVLIVKDGATTGKTAFYNGNYKKAAINEHVFLLRSGQNVMAYFIYNIIRSDVFQNKLKKYIKGIIGGISLEIKEIQIPLPPLDVQKEIVAEIEGYQKIIDGARQIVENYKPQIQIDPKWPMVELGKVCEINPKKSELSSIDKLTEVSFVPMAEINENNIYFNSSQTRTIKEVYAGYTYFKDDDVLLAKVTPCFENGKAGIARKLVNGIGFGSSELFILRSSIKIRPRWIYYNIITNRFKENGKLRMTGTGGLQRVPKDYLVTYKIPLPTISKQEKIIEEIEIEMNIVETNKNLVAIFEQKIKDKIARVWGE